MDGVKKLKVSNSQQVATGHYKKLSDLDSVSYSPVIVTIKSMLDTVKSKGTDYVTTLTISDEDYNQIDVKIFTKKPKFAGCFKENDIVRILNIKLSTKPGVAITGKGSEIEVIGNINREDPDVFLTECETNKFKMLKACAGRKHQPKNDVETCTIEEIKPDTYFSFIGLLLSVIEEKSDLTILTMVDFTKSELVRPVVLNGAYTNDMTLSIKVWGEKGAQEMKKLKLDRIYQIPKLKIGDITMVLEPKVSESFLQPFIELEETSSAYNEIIERQKKYFAESETVALEEKKTPTQFEKYPLMKIANISNHKMFRIHARVVSFFPFKPATVKFCENCKSFESKQIKFTKQTSCKETEECQSYEDKILRVMFRDSSGTCVILLKNELCDLFMKDLEKFRSFDLEYLVIRSGKFNFLMNVVF